ncbi:MAG: GIY-YIG nuclease family protein [Parahaliea sp.]
MDGTPGGLLTAEIMNWTGHVITGPRSRLGELLQRPEVGRTGIYFLVGPDPENNFRPLVYIGESDDVGKRLKQHNRPEEQGGKDFWERVCLVTSKDQNLTKAHVKHLESWLINKAKQVGRCQLLNSTAHDYGNLPESDLADMAFFAEQVRTVLPVLGFDFLRETSKPVKTPAVEEAGATSESPIFVLEIPKHKLRASAQEIDGEFFVLAGSLARATWSNNSHSGYRSLHDQLCEERALAPVPWEDGLLQFASDKLFASPSAAAAVVSGRVQWKVEGTGQSYGEWQDSQVNASPEKLYVN